MLYLQTLCIYEQIIYSRKFGSVGDEGAVGGGEDDGDGRSETDEDGLAAELR